MIIDVFEHQLIHLNQPLIYKKKMFSINDLKGLDERNPNLEAKTGLKLTLPAQIVVGLEKTREQYKNDFH